MLFRFIGVLALTVVVVSELPAQAAQHVLFGGLGAAAGGNPSEYAGTPWVVGYTYRTTKKPVYLGFDIAGEGTSLNNTSGMDDVVEQGISFNFLIGGSTAFWTHWRAWGGALVGFRQTGKSCPDSYLGYECYADEDPDVDYGANIGVTGNLAFKKLLVGARLTGESTQYVVGVVF